MVEVRVADTGPGLPAEVRARLFQPFVTTKPNGLGVGLSICRSIIESHGGQLSAEDNPVGGTVFRFTLPASAPGSEAIDPDQSAPRGFEHNAVDRIRPVLEPL
jgi:signal transduction histidine kinase